MYQERPNKIFPTINFVFSHGGHFSWGGGGVLLWCTAIRILPWSLPPTSMERLKRDDDVGREVVQTSLHQQRSACLLGCDPGPHGEGISRRCVAWLGIVLLVNIWWGLPMPPPLECPFGDSEGSAALGLHDCANMSLMLVPLLVLCTFLSVCVVHTNGGQLDEDTRAVVVAAHPQGAQHHMQALGIPRGVLGTDAASAPGLCLVIQGGGGGAIGPPGLWLTPPPTHIRKFFFRKKMKFIKGARTWRSILGTQTFFWPLTPPPPPGIVSTSH